MNKNDLRQLLLSLLGDDSDEKLGFCDRPQASEGRYVFVNRNHGTCWYEWDKEANKPINISQEAISGFLLSIDSRETEFKGKKSYKLVITFDCGAQGLIKLESETKTTFSRLVLLTLDRMPQSELDKVLTLAVKAGNEEKVVLPELYVEGQRVPLELPEDWRSESFDMSTVFKSVVSKVNQ